MLTRIVRAFVAATIAGLVMPGLAAGETPVRAHSIADIPGIPLSGSPVTAYMSSTQLDHVYSVDLAEGQSLTVTVVGAASQDLDLMLYPPGTSTVNTLGGTVAAAENGVGSRETLTYRATQAGTYYVDVFNYGETGGTYTLTHNAIASLGADDDLPGIAMVAELMTGTLGGGDELDVYSVELRQFENVTFDLSGGEGTDFDLTLLGPGASVASWSEGEVGSLSESYPESLHYTAPVAGRYYVLVERYSGTGPYTLSKHITAGIGQASISCQVAPSSPSYGRPAVITARVADAVSGNSPDGIAVLESRSCGASGPWFIRTEAALTAGTCSFSWISDIAHDYRVRLVGSSSYRGGVSASVRVTPRCGLGLPSHPRTAMRNRPFAVSGLLKPRHRAGSYP
ncbi:MAG: hypothetical protein FDZ75_01840, partial [Actinobacteria bacterium]